LSKVHIGYPFPTLHARKRAFRKEIMKHTTIDHGVILKMALVGFEIEKERIEAAIAQIQSRLGNDDTSRSTPTHTSEPAAPRRKRFSAAARKRMAAAQKKRWKALRAQQQANTKKPKPKAKVKRRKATVATARTGRIVQVKATKKVARKVVVKAISRPKAKTAAPKPKNTPAEAPNVTVETPATPVEIAAEPAPATQ